MNNKKVFSKVNSNDKSITMVVPMNNSQNSGGQFGHSLYKSGTTKVVKHWNYVRIYMSKLATQCIVGGVTASAVEAVKTAIATVLTGPIAAAIMNILFAGLSAALGVYAASKVKGGSWIDVNYLTDLLDQAGWQ